MGIPGGMGGDGVTIFFFGLMESGTVLEPKSATERGLVAYYPFDGDVRDHSGNENHATNNGATFIPGVKNQSLQFDGKDDYVNSPVNINPDVLPQVTITTWAKSTSATRGTVIAHDNGGYDRGIDIDTRGGGTGWSAFSGSGGVLGYQPVEIGEWVFLTAVYDQDAETVKLYANGEMYEERGILGRGFEYTHIGANPGFRGTTFSGAIDEVRIYNYALTQREIAALAEGATIPTQDAGVGVPQEFNGLIFESRSKPSGSSVQIPLTLRNIDDNIGNMDMELSYDSSVLEASEVIKGSLTSKSLFESNIMDGNIKISFADRNGFSGNGSVAYIKFDVKGQEGSSSPLEIVGVSANSADDMAEINILTRDGVFNVVSLEKGRGDASGDGKLTARDALEALLMAVGKIPEDLVLDMNNDGSVTSIDARIILQMATEPMN